MKRYLLSTLAVLALCATASAQVSMYSDVGPWAPGSLHTINVDGGTPNSTLRVRVAVEVAGSETPIAVYRYVDLDENGSGMFNQSIPSNADGSIEFFTADSESPHISRHTYY